MAIILSSDNSRELTYHLDNDKIWFKINRPNGLRSYFTLFIPNYIEKKTVGSTSYIECIDIIIRMKQTTSPKYVTQFCTYITTNILPHIPSDIKDAIMARMSRYCPKLQENDGQEDSIKEITFMSKETTFMSKETTFMSKETTFMSKKTKTGDEDIDVFDSLNPVENTVSIQAYTRLTKCYNQQIIELNKNKQEAKIQKFHKLFSKNVVFLIDQSKGGYTLGLEMGKYVQFYEVYECIGFIHMLKTQYAKIFMPDVSFEEFHSAVLVISDKHNTNFMQFVMRNYL